MLERASRKSELLEGERSEFIGLSKIDTGCKQFIFSNVGFENEKAELLPAG